MTDDRRTIDIPRKVGNSRYPDRYENSHVQTNLPDLSNEDMYLNLTIHNFNETGTIPCSYTENRKKAMLINGVDYKMSVVRFDCPSQEIPMFFWPGDDKFLIGVRTYDDAGNVIAGEQYITYPSRDNPVPADNDKAIWTVDQMVQAINAAIDTICTNAPFVAGHPMFDDEDFRPRLIYTPESQIFSWKYKYDITGALEWATLAWNTTDAPDSAYVYSNQKLDFLFDNFPKIELKTNGVVNEIRYKVYNNYNNIVNLPDFNNPPDFDPLLYYIMEQQHSSINLWYELYKIVITSNMEIRKEFIGVATDNAQNANPDSLNARGILTDFDIAFPRASSLRINYSPSAEFRWIDILKSGPLDLLDFSIYYQTQNGQLRNLLLEPGQAANLKILFRKK